MCTGVNMHNNSEAQSQGSRPGDTGRETFLIAVADKDQVPDPVRSGLWVITRGDCSTPETRALSWAIGVTADTFGVVHGIELFHKPGRAEANHHARPPLRVCDPLRGFCPPR
jgi:hypothetical protein